MKSVEMQKYTLEENSTTYCTPRSHPGETPTAGPRVRNVTPDNMSHSFLHIFKSRYL